MSQGRSEPSKSLTTGPRKLAVIELSGGGEVCAFLATAIHPGPRPGQNLCSTCTDRPAVLTTSLTALVSCSGCSRSVSKSSRHGPPYCFGRVHLTSRECPLNKR